MIIVHLPTLLVRLYKSGGCGVFFVFVNSVMILRGFNKKVEMLPGLSIIIKSANMSTITWRSILTFLNCCQNSSVDLNKDMDQLNTTKKQEKIDIKDKENAVDEKDTENHYEVIDQEPAIRNIEPRAKMMTSSYKKGGKSCGSRDPRCDDIIRYADLDFGIPEHILAAGGTPGGADKLDEDQTEIASCVDQQEENLFCASSIAPLPDDHPAPSVYGLLCACVRIKLGQF